MTLCIVWREGPNIKFASDSRLSFGNAGVSDFGIKVVRIPFNVYGASDSSDRKSLILSGDLGMAFAGSAIGALMVKEALAEALICLQSVPIAYKNSMEGIANFSFCAYKMISRDVCAAILERGCTCVVFAGFCSGQKKLRAFRMKTDLQQQTHFSEVLTGENDIEIFGTPAAAVLARKLIANNVQQKTVIKALQSVIDDQSINEVGGNIQFGSFDDSKFQPAGVAKQSDCGVHYWRASLDLNSPEFDQANVLIPNFPLLDLIE